MVDLQAILDHCPTGNVAVLVDDQPSALSQLILLAYPGLALHEFHTETEKGRLHAELAARARYDLILIDAANSPTRTALFRNVFSHLKAGGTFFVRTFRMTDSTADERPYDPHLWPVLAKLMPVRGGLQADPTLSWQQRDRIAMAEALGRMIVDEDHLILTNRVTRYAKLRDEEMNTILELRGEELGILLQIRPAVTFNSLCVLRRNVEQLKSHRDGYVVPTMSIREYHRTVCLPLESRCGTISSCRKPIGITGTSGSRARPWRANPTSSPTYHCTSRAVGWTDLISTWPRSTRAISDTSCRKWSQGSGAGVRQRSGIRRSRPYCHEREAARCRASCTACWQRTASVTNDIELYGPHETVEVETLIGVTPMYSMPDYVHPGIADVWSTIGRNLAAEADPGAIPKRILVVRPPGAIRPCRNEADVIERFRRAGFETVRPETLPLADQVALFRGADVIAGFAGSALVNLLYCDAGKRVIVVGPSSYTSSNDYMIGSILGHEIDQVLSAADVQQPPGGWSREAFLSGWSFDFEREGRLLNVVLDDLDDPNPDQLAAAYAKFRKASPEVGSRRTSGGRRGALQPSTGTSRGQDRQTAHRAEELGLG